MLALALLMTTPLAAAAPDIGGPTHVCLIGNTECYYLPYANCASGYDENGAGDPVGYGCTRGLAGACVFQYPDGDGTSCVVLLAPDEHGHTCVLSYSPWEYGSGYDRFVCIGTL